MYACTVGCVELGLRLMYVCMYVRNVYMYAIRLLSLGSGLCDVVPRSRLLAWALALAAPCALALGRSRPHGCAPGLAFLLWVAGLGVLALVPVPCRSLVACFLCGVGCGGVSLLWGGACPSAVSDDVKA